MLLRHATHDKHDADNCHAPRYMNVARHVRAFGVGAPSREDVMRSSEDLDVRRKRLLYHCWHRGMREMDLIMGRFADAAIAELSDDDVGVLERLNEVSDPELYGWVTGEASVPRDYDTPLFRRLQAFFGGAGSRA